MRDLMHNSTHSDELVAPAKFVRKVMFAINIGRPYLYTYIVVINLQIPAPVLTPAESMFKPMTPCE